MRIFLGLSALAISGAFAGLPALAQVTPPKISATSLKQPLPRPYDEKANAGADVDAALGRAKRSGKRVLIEFGGNWCPDCRVLAGVLALPEVRGFVRRHFETVAVDIGRFDKNLDVLARLEVGRPAGVPAVLVLSADGVALNRQDLVALADARTMTPQSVVDWLAKWAQMQ
jgi:thiol-disulfide isomerase/thioredoxin